MASLSNSRICYTIAWPIQHYFKQYGCVRTRIFNLVSLKRNSSRIQIPTKMVPYPTRTESSFTLLWKPKTHINKGMWYHTRISTELVAWLALTNSRRSVSQLGAYLYTRLTVCRPITSVWQMIQMVTNSLIPAVAIRLCQRYRVHSQTLVSFFHPFVAIFIYYRLLFPVRTNNHAYVHDILICSCMTKAGY